MAKTHKIHLSSDQLYQKVLEALCVHDAKCLDNEWERDHVAAEIVSELTGEDYEPRLEDPDD